MSKFNDGEITITRHNRTVVATDGKNYGVARCCPEDEFDFITGAKLALERLGNKMSGAREVKRHAKEGEYIKIVKAWMNGSDYKNGDIFRVNGENREAGLVFVKGLPTAICSSEYVVLENYIPKKEKQQYYNGKIIFTKGDDVFKTGCIYEIKDGKIDAKHPVIKKLPYHYSFSSLGDVEDYFTSSFGRKCKRGWSIETLEFLEVKEI